jgi:hypothetical protein
VTRPDTFVKCLDHLVDWLDACDKYITTFGPAVGTGLGEGKTAQEDLRRLAAALADEPGLDAQIMALLRGDS